ETRCPWLIEVWPFIDQVGPVSSAVEKSKNHNFDFGDVEGNRDAPLKADCSQAGADMIVPRATLRNDIEATDVAFESLDVCERCVRCGVLSYPVIDRDEVVSCGRRECDFAPDHSLFLSVRRCLWCFRTSSNAESTDRACSELDFMAS